MAKTYSIERLGISIYGRGTKREAEKAWEDARDAFLARAGEMYLFAFRGYTAVVVPERQPDCWSYAITEPTDSGRQYASCFFSAASQCAALAVAVGSLAQRMWTRDLPDDEAFFDELTRAAGLTTGAEIAHERSNFLTVARHWRDHQSTLAA